MCLPPVYFFFFDTAHSLPSPVLPSPKACVSDALLPQRYVILAQTSVVICTAQALSQQLSWVTPLDWLDASPVLYATPVRVKSATKQPKDQR